MMGYFFHFYIHIFVVLYLRAQGITHFANAKTTRRSVLFPSRTIKLNAHPADKHKGYGSPLAVVFTNKKEAL